MSSGSAPFSSAWLRQDPASLAFLPAGFRDLEDRRSAVARAGERRVLAPVLDALRAQNPSTSPSSDVAVSLAKLADARTAVVVTGQQVGLFLGPLFTIYKAATAIAMARLLEEETGHAVVPLFWLQTEDHDLAEIDHCHLPTSDGGPSTLRLTWSEIVDPATSRCPVGVLPVGPGIREVLATLAEALRHHPHAEEHLVLLEATYHEGATLAEAFAALLRALFAGTGLLVLDPRRPSLAELARPLYRRVLDEASVISSRLEHRVRELEAAGFAAQVHVRPGSPLCFFSPDGEAGPRFRLDPAPNGEGFSTREPVPRVFGHAEICDHLDQEPLRFTTSALLRPLLQDVWLPTAAYVGGPGEINYFAQLTPLYEHLGVTMPLVVPRARFRLVDDRASGLLEKLGLSPEEGAAPVDEILARLVAKNTTTERPGPADIERQLLTALEGPLGAFARQAAALDPSLQKSVDAAERAIRDAIERAVAKYGRVLARRDEVNVERAHRLSTLLAPEGKPQERVYGLPYYACRYGGAAVVRRVLDEVRPLEPTLKDLLL